MTSPTIFPVLSYRDPARAVQWLAEAYGFEEKEVSKGEDGTIVHAEMAYGNGLVMFGKGSAEAEPRAARGGTSVYVVVEDVDGHYKQAKAAGAEIVMELVDQDYGSREYGSKDFEGNTWYFGTYAPAPARS